MINTNQIHKELSNSNIKITRLCHKLLDDTFLDANGRIKEELKFKINNPTQKIQNSKFISKPEDTFETMLFLPPGEGRQGEGGLRTKGYFKHSYKLVDGKWFIADSDNNPVIPAPEDIQSKIKQYLSSNAQYQTPITELPLITVITVVYNGAKYLEETILSVINQTYPNVEYIIIDGGSTDGTLDIIKQYEDYIDYWVSERDKGIYDAMNKGIRVALGKWINFMNGGDRLIFLDLNSLLKLNTSNTSYYYHEQQHKIKRDPFTKMYLTHNTPCHQSIFYKKDEIVPFDLDYPIIADFVQMTKICTKNIRPVFSEHVVYFAKAGFSYENNHDKSWSKLWSRVKIVSKNIGLFYGFVAFLHAIRIKLK